MRTKSQIPTGTRLHVMAALRNAAISAPRSNSASTNCHHTRDSHRPLALV